MRLRQFCGSWRDRRGADRGSRFRTTARRALAAARPRHLRLNEVDCAGQGGRSMNDAAPLNLTAARSITEHFDVLIVGAGISGIGAAYHLTQQCPGTSFVVLEAQETFGGTWWTHKYPGIRSDSDLYTAFHTQLP